MIMRTKRYRSPKKNSYTTYEDLEKMGLGSWLKENAGMVGTGVGMLGYLGGPALGAVTTAAGSQIGGNIQKGYEMDQQQEQQDKMVAQQNALSQSQATLQRKLSQNPLTSYAPTMCHGGRVRGMAGGGNIGKPTEIAPVVVIARRPRKKEFPTLQEIKRRNVEYLTGSEAPGLYRDVTIRYPEGKYETKSYNEQDFSTLLQTNPALFESHPKYKALVQKGQGGTINYNGQYHEGPDGGVPVDSKGNYNPTNPSALVEKGEVGYGTPDGGTYIFSNSLELSKGKTFADRAKRIQGRYKRRMQDGKVTDPISKVGYDAEMNELMSKQESVREFNGLNEETEEMKKGGWIASATRSIKRRGTEGVCTGSKFGSSTCPPGSKRYNLAKTFRKMAKNREHGGDLPIYDGGGGINKYSNGYTYFIPDDNLDDNMFQSELTADSMVSDISSEIKPYQMSIPSNVPEQTTYSPYEGMNWYEAAIPAGVSAVSNLILANRAKRYNPRKLNLARQVAPTINLEPERASAREQANVARVMNRRNLRESGATPSQYMSGTSAGNIGVQRVLGDQLSKSYQTESLTNLQARQAADQMNAEMELQEQMYNSQLEANKQAQMDQYYMNAMTAPLLGMKDYLQSRSDASKLQMSQPNQQLMWEYDPNKPFGRRRRMVKRENTGK